MRASLACIAAAALAATAAAQVDGATNSTDGVPRSLRGASLPELRRLQERVLQPKGARSVQFAGYTWDVRDSGGVGVEPGPNVFDSGPGAVTVDSRGLVIASGPRGGNCGQFAAAEAMITQALGYGTYLFRLTGPVEELDKDLVLGAFLFDHNTGNDDNGYNELDLEFARWGNGADPTSGQFVVKPLRPQKVPGWRMRFPTASIPRGPPANVRGEDGACGNPTAPAVSQTTFALQWLDGSLRFAIWSGHHGLGSIGGAAGNLIASYTYGAKEHIPVAPPAGAGGPKVHFNLWTLDMSRVPSGRRRVEFALNGFEFSAGGVDLGVPANANVSPAN